MRAGACSKPVRVPQLVKDMDESCNRRVAEAAIRQAESELLAGKELAELADGYIPMRGYGGDLD